MSIGRRSKAQVAVSRPIVYKRDGRCCVVDGLFESVRWPCAGSLTIQHRRTKGMGGSALGDEPKSLVAMCAMHNLLQTADAGFAEVCRQYGWAVPRFIADRNDLSRIPVRYVDGWFLLSGEDRFRVSDDTARELMFEAYGDLFD